MRIALNENPNSIPLTEIHKSETGEDQETEISSITTPPQPEDPKNNVLKARSTDDVELIALSDYKKNSPSDSTLIDEKKKIETPQSINTSSNFFTSTAPEKVEEPFDNYTKTEQLCIRDCIRAAQQKDEHANIYRGICHLGGFGVEKDYIKAYQLLSPEGDNFGRNPVALYYLGICYQLGLGTEKNDIKAFTRFLISATAGFAPAQYETGLYYTQEIIDKDYQKAVEYFKAAADQGDPDAYFSLGTCYKEGKGVPQNLDKAKEYFQLAAKREGVTTRYYSPEVLTFVSDYFKSEKSELTDFKRNGL